MRQITNLILGLLRTGCQWRNLPDCRPAWPAVYYYFEAWKQNGTFERINAALTELDRKRVGEKSTPSPICIDSQSVKLSPMIFENRGLDPRKRINGRKRQLAIDMQGRLLAAHVQAANEADGRAGSRLISDVLWRFGERLEKVLGDQAYKGVFADELARWSIDRSGDPV